MPNRPEQTVLPTESFDAIFRAESLEERVEFQQCDVYNPAGCPDPGDPGSGGPTTVTPEPATLLMSAIGLGGVGAVSYLRRRSAKRKNDTPKQD